MEFYSVIKSNRSLVVIVLLSFFILSSPVPGVCHSPDMKKNASIHATVISVERSGLKIRTDKGLLLVKNVATTPIFHRNQAVSLQHLQPGMKLVVAGSMRPARLFSARMIVIEDQELALHHKK